MCGHCCVCTISLGFQLRDACILCESVLYTSLNSLCNRLTTFFIDITLDLAIASIIFSGLALGAAPLLLFIFLLMSVVLADYVEVRVFRLECALRHVAQVARGLRVVTPTLLNLILRDLKDAQVLRQIFHCKRIFWGKIFDLFHGEEPRIEFGENLSKLDIVELLYFTSHI